MHTQALFHARTGGYHICRIPVLGVTPAGTVLATVEARRGSGHDYDDSDLLFRRSQDGGLSWEPPRLLASNRSFGPGPMSSCVLASDCHRHSVIALFGHNCQRVFMSRSTDDGMSWSPVTEITSACEAFRKRYPWRVCVVGPGHATQLRSGRLVVPVWLSDGSGTEMGAGRLGHRPSAASVIYSDDGGETWCAGEIICRDGEHVNGHVVRNPSETVLFEREDGRVVCNMRNESPMHRRLTAVSDHNLTEWTELRWDYSLYEPVCMASMMRYRWRNADTPSSVLFCNPCPVYDAPDGDLEARKCLVIRNSQDDGLTWPQQRVIDSGWAGYSDLATAADGTILCLYERGVIDGGCDIRQIALARFSMEWITDHEV